jgi:hypothetical protein
MGALNGDAVFESFKGLWINPAMDPHSVGAHPACGRKFQVAGQLSIIGQQNKPFTVKVQASHGNNPREVFGERVKEGGAPQFILVRGDEAFGLIVKPEARRGLLRERFFVHHNTIFRGDTKGGRIQNGSIHKNAPLADPGLCFPPGTKARASHDLGDALTLIHDRLG